MDDGASTCCTATRWTQQTDEAPAGGSATIGSATSAVATIGSATSAVAKSNHGQRPPLQPDHRGMVELPGGPFLMGSTDTTFPADAEGPVREVVVPPFWIDVHAVTNTDFARFVAATGYETEAERFHWSFVFYQFIAADHPPTRGVAAAPWWREVHGATWRSPEGPGSDVAARGDHPVVHVSWNDAAAYAGWAGKRLPTEAEWEYAARGGLEQKLFPWGDELTPGGEHRCNVWQGVFPNHDAAEDGFNGTCPVDTYRPNGFGLYNMAGNSWEWCADQWGSSSTMEGSIMKGNVMKGGSYLCHASYCNRYRVAARTHSSADSSTGHTGFRLVADA